MMSFIILFATSLAFYRAIDPIKHCNIGIRQCKVIFTTKMKHSKRIVKICVCSNMIYGKF